jgi:hypothetical protein
MNTKKQGDVGLGVAIAYFTQASFTVCVPLTDSQAYDLVVEKENVVWRVQVKSTTFKSRSGNYFVSLTVKGGNRSGIGKIKKFDGSKVEALFISTGDGSRYLIPSSKIETQTITLCEEYSIWKV